MSSSGPELFRDDLHSIRAARRALGEEYEPGAQAVETLTEGLDW